MNFMSQKESGTQVKPITNESFDIDKLAKDIDILFEDKIVDVNEELTKSLDDVNSKVKEATLSLKSLSDKELQDFKRQVQNTYTTIKEDLILEIQKGRATIVINTSQQIRVEHLDHPQFESVVKCLERNKKAMLVGPAGTGKTTMIEHIAERKQLPFHKYSCSRDSSVHDLLGYKQPTSETYLNTTFLECYENGGIFLVDEYDAMSGDMALFFNGVCDNSKFISVPHRDNKPKAIKHKDFYIVMCGNTYGKGSVEYSGRDFQDLALLDRFRFSRYHIGYHIELEKSLIERASQTNPGISYQKVLALRAKLEKIGSYLSTRNVEDISNLMAQGTRWKEVIDILIQDLPDIDKSSFKSED